MQIFSLMIGEIIDGIIKGNVVITAEDIVESIYRATEDEIRFEILSRGLGTMDPDLALEVLNYIRLKARSNQLRYKLALIHLLDTGKLAESLSRQKIGRLYLLAQKKGYRELIDLITRTSDAKKRRVKHPASTDLKMEPDPKMEYVTLGEKMSLAKCRIKDTLDRLLYESDTKVIRNLLQNPRITEKEVIKIASKRPNTREVLTLILNNPKWISRYNVKRAIIRNPYTPTNISLGLLHFMLLQDLEDILNDRSLNPSLVEMAKTLIRERTAVNSKNNK